MAKLRVLYCLKIVGCDEGVVDVCFLMAKRRRGESVREVS